jgi:hypothetical protein
VSLITKQQGCATTHTAAVAKVVIVAVAVAAAAATAIVVVILFAIATNILAQQQWQPQQQWEGEGQGNSAFFHHKAYPRCIILVAVVDEPSLALLSLLLLSPLPFLSPLLFLLLSPSYFRCCPHHHIVFAATFS